MAKILPEGDRRILRAVEQPIPTGFETMFIQTLSRKYGSEHRESDSIPRQAAWALIEVVRQILRQTHIDEELQDHELRRVLAEVFPIMELLISQDMPFLHHIRSHLNGDRSRRLDSESSEKLRKWITVSLRLADTSRCHIISERVLKNQVDSLVDQLGAMAVGLQAERGVSSEQATTAAKLMAELERKKLDALTGVLGMEAFFGEVEILKLNHAKIAIIFGDFNGLKQINDVLVNHFAGDEVIKHITRIMKEELREEDKLARRSGDESFVALPGASTTEAVQAVLLRILKRIDQEPIRLPLVDVSEGAEVGQDVSAVLRSRAIQYVAGWESRLAGFNRAQIVDGELHIYATIAFGVTWLNGDGESVKNTINTAELLMSGAKKVCKGLDKNAAPDAIPLHPPHNAIFIDGEEEPHIFEPGFANTL